MNQETISVERAAHAELWAIAERFNKQYGLQIVDVSFDWANYANIGEPVRPTLCGVTIHSATTEP